MSEPIQFEQAEYEAPQDQACANCGITLRGEYYECNGQMVCGSCASNLNLLLAGQEQQNRMLPAAGAGLAAAAVGSAVYAAVRLTGYELSLIAILVGWLVGRAVRWGSGGIGGRRYQVLAVVLTYLGITSSYIPFLIRQLDADPLFLLLLSLWLPFAQGWRNILGILIIGIGLWEAWRLNRAAKVQVTGPYSLKLGGARAN